MSREHHNGYHRSSMWLRKEINSICLKEFKLRHHLDILQGNSYISFNVDQLVTLVTEYSSEKPGHWQDIASRCNFFWYNILGYFKLFPGIYVILDQKKFLTFDIVILRKETVFNILKARIKSVRNFVEIARTISYRAQLKAEFAKSIANRDLFNTLSSLSNSSDPPGDKLLALGNRIVFIKEWLNKLVLKHQHSLKSIQKFHPLPIFPEIPHSIAIGLRSPRKQDIRSDPDLKATRIVSNTKPFVRFSIANNRSKRLSDILDDEDSSHSSSDSIWSAPFKKLKRSTK